MSGAEDHPGAMALAMNTAAKSSRWAAKVRGFNVGDRRLGEGTSPAAIAAIAAPPPPPLPQTVGRGREPPGALRKYLPFPRSRLQADDAIRDDVASISTRSHATHTALAFTWWRRLVVTGAGPIGIMAVASRAS